MEMYLTKKRLGIEKQWLIELAFYDILEARHQWHGLIA